MKKQLLSLLTLTTLSLSIANAQWVTNAPSSTSSTVGIGTTTPVSPLQVIGGATFGTNGAPTQTVNILGNGVSLNLTGTYTQSGVGQVGGSTIGLDGWKIKTTFGPAYGSGALTIGGTSTNLCFSSNGGLVFGNTEGFRLGRTNSKFLFDGSIGAATLILGQQTGSTVPTIPSGNVLGIMGSGYVRDVLTLGTPDVTKATFQLGVAGNATVNGLLVIGKPVNFTQATPFPTGYSLFVENGILTEKVKVAVKTTANWADYVFAEDYKLKSLEEVETFVNANKHLPGVPSAKEVVANGLDLATMDAKLLEKIEELTLYMIELKKQNDMLATKNDILATKLEALSK